MFYIKYNRFLTLCYRLLNLTFDFLLDFLDFVKFYPILNQFNKQF